MTTQAEIYGKCPTGLTLAQKGHWWLVWCSAIEVDEVDEEEANHIADLEIWKRG